MNNYLVTGRAGSGKSTVCTELQSRGLQAEDGDNIPGLASWIELETGQKVEVDVTKFIDESKVDWLWNSDVLRKWLASPKEKFLCGSAGNDLDFLNSFAKVFVLTVDPFIHTVRLQTRSSAYAKEPTMIQRKLYEQHQFAAQAIELGAIAISAHSSVKIVVDEILAQI